MGQIRPVSKPPVFPKVKNRKRFRIFPLAVGLAESVWRGLRPRGGLGVHAIRLSLCITIPKSDGRHAAARRRLKGRSIRSGDALPARKPVAAGRIEANVTARIGLCALVRRKLVGYIGVGELAVQ